MARKDICLIVPTVRDFECVRKYYANARNNGTDLSRIHTLFITEDSCDRKAMESVFQEEGVSGEVFDHRDRHAWFKEQDIQGYESLIPRRSPTETSFGLLYIQANQQYKYGFFVDDDTVPLENQDFFGTHIHNLQYEGPIDVVSSDKRWVNVLYQNFRRHGLYPRGHPYSAMDEKACVKRGEVRDVVCSQGLWTNVPDIDAVRLLSNGNLRGQARTRTIDMDFPGNFVVSPGNYLALCSMNIAFKREIIPVFYQLPMDDNRWKIGRFGDTWSGIFLKRATDTIGKNIISGHPLCEHNSIPRSTFRDLDAEAPGLEINERLWKLVDDTSLAGNNWHDIYRAMAESLRSAVPTLSSPNRRFLSFLAQAMIQWADCCEVL